MQMKHLSAFTSLVVQLLHMLTQPCRSHNTRLRSPPAVWYQTCGGVGGECGTHGTVGRLAGTVSFIFFLICATLSCIWTIQTVIKINCLPANGMHCRPDSQWACRASSMIPLLLCCAITCCRLKSGIVADNQLSRRCSTGRFQLRRASQSLSCGHLFVLKFALTNLKVWWIQNSWFCVPACEFSPAYLLLVQTSFSTCSVIKILFDWMCI